MQSTKPLPPKEKALFNRILKCYEQKQYRNGLKFAKQILSNPKFTEHGETLAMKGLTLNCLNRKEEAYDLVKRGLKNDLTSHVCWHVYGLLQRSDKKYDEAIKCYRNALRWDKENLHILRDLSMLQVHMRDLEGYRDTRYTLLQLKPGQRASWIGYAIANHLLKDYNTAYEVLEEFRKTQQTAQSGDYEYSELVLYQNSILQEAGMFKAASDHLMKNKDRITDQLRLLESQADLSLHLKEFEKAEDIFTSLIYRNPENHKYYLGLEAAIKPSNEEEKLQIYDAIEKLFPKADAPKVLPLKLINDMNTFRSRVDIFIKKQLRRGVPPLFITLKCVYKNPNKVQVIEELVQGYLECMRRCERLSENDQLEPPTTLLWIQYYLAQHYDKCGNTNLAFQYVNDALEHTPTLIELHVLKAKILWHAGDSASAVAAIDEAQSLDTADRYINYKCACYMIRNHMVKDAEVMAAKFTRETVSVQEYLREMQCMWFEVECAHSHFKTKNYGEALKKCHEIDRHFKEIMEDQFDFHQYCMRKMTLRAYVQMLKLEDSLRAHRFYFEAAKVAINVYISLHDKPLQMNGDQDSLNEKSLSKSELKKMRNKQRKQERKKAAEEEKRKQEQEKLNKQRQHRNKNDDDGEVSKKEEIDPKKLLETTAPLDDAKSFLSPLLLHYSDELETHLLAYEIYERQEKFLLMLKALLKAKHLSEDGTHPKYHKCLVRFLQKVESGGLKGAVKSVIENLIPKLSDKLSLEEYNSRYLENHAGSLPHCFAGLCALKFYESTISSDEIAERIMNWSDMQGITLKMCLEIEESIKNGDLGKWSENAKIKFKEICNKRYPRAVNFKSVEDETGAHIKENGLDSNHLVNHNCEKIESC